MHVYIMHVTYIIHLRDACSDLIQYRITEIEAVLSMQEKDDELVIIEAQVRTCVCMCVCMYACVYICVSTSTFKDTHTHTHRNMYTLFMLAQLWQECG